MRRDSLTIGDGTQPPAEPPESGLVADLERLQALRDAGAVDEAEYTIAKRRVLES